MAGVFEEHDHSAFETIAVSFLRDEKSPMRRRLLKAFDRFVDVEDKSDSEVARLLKASEVDIAVDLMGYTGASRPGIFAFRPAPIQVNYLGFPGTLGANHIDYIFADSTVIPAEHLQHYSESVVYLPDMTTFQDMNAAYREIFTKDLPARATVGTGLMGADAGVEIMFTAVK